MRKRVLVCDMDNTLLNSASQVSPENLEAIRSHVRAGGYFTIATGRAPAAIRLFPELVELVNLPIVTGNGGQVCDLHSGEVYRRWTLPPEADGLVRAALERFPRMGAVAYYDLDGFCLFRGNEYTAELIHREGRPAVPVTLDEHPRPLNKYLMTECHAYMEEVRAFLAPQVGAVGRLVFSEANFLELLPLGVSKGAALLDLLERSGLDRLETVAMGDAQNDREMLEEAGLGVAVDNADPALKAAADAVVCHHDGPAVRECLERFF